ncbi:Yip1 family protein [Novosphingobium sp.]|uniref:Yip1 family protein n=1 Tax=Novosphingobium sp. TaxID=1874826 RepID=UPI0025F2DA50|nr:Yip1 family protein [Novosphingobium sp.]MCC6925380.1 YIP1 family protein [Novosphingobium sp.]
MELGKGPELGGLLDRAKAIILQPSETWPTLAAEQTTPGDIVTRYALPLAAIGPIASFIGGQVFGISLFLVTFKPGLMTGLTMALTSFVMSLISLVIVALVADFLAPNFGGQANRTQAFKLVAASMTPGWIAGILGIIPALAALGIIASIYGIYLFYKGSTPLMKVPEDKSIVYTLVTVVAAIVLGFVAATITSTVTGALGVGAAGLAANSGDSAEVNIPGVGKFDTANLEQAGKQMEAAANGQVPPVDTAKLQALLPASLGAYTRTALDTGAMGAMGKGVSATYTSGDKSIKLSVIDSAGLGALAGLAGAMGAEQSHEDADGYDRTSTVGGQIVVEKWSKGSSSGEFSQQVASRFFISAEGEAGSIDELKSAVASIDQGALAGLAK